MPQKADDTADDDQSEDEDEEQELIRLRNENAERRGRWLALICSSCSNPNPNPAQTGRVVRVRGTTAESRGQRKTVRPTTDPSQGAIRKRQGVRMK